MKNPNIQATAAVAIIRCDQPTTSYLLLRRASHPKDPWSGHFAFPGGRKESYDNTLLDTCLRETKEETGIQLDVTQLVQTLHPEPAGQNFNTLVWVQPFLFTLSERPEIILDKTEIVNSFWVSATQFEQPSSHSETEMLPGRFFPTFPLQDYYLWGFTYKLLGKIIKE
ncbi:MAG: 8-oxo-dGTP diphosphatase [Desulforhopalus sp.]|jgi:8-oxo-dGTP diphosphatase